MSKGIKITLGVLISLAVVSGIFLLTSKKKASPTAQTNKTVATTAKTAPKNNPQPVKKAPAPKTDPAAAKAAVSNQWQQCKSKTLAASQTLFWNVQISESIPAGGTYAKGTLDNNSAQPVHVIIKSGIANADQLKQRLVVGKTVILRGTCTDVATDGSAVLQAF